MKKLLGIACFLLLIGAPETFAQNGAASSPPIGGGSSGTVTAVTGTAPIVSSGGTTPAISCPTCLTGLALPLTVSGTVNSGGIPYFSSTTQMSSSAALTANALIKGGGAGVAPSASTITDAGSGAQVGSPTGGAQGAGTLNATGLFVNGAAVSVATNYNTITGWCTGTVGTGSGTAYVLNPAEGGATTSNACSNNTATEPPMPVACTAKNLFVVVGTASSAAGSAITFYHNGVASTLTAPIGTGTSAHDTTHTVTIAQGDTWSVRAVPAQATDTMASIKASFQCQ